MMDMEYLFSTSDGMGTGRLASIESKMVINHFKRLIKAGVEYVAIKW